MTLKIGYDLNLKQIQSTINNIENSSNELVKKILAEETKYKTECKKLENYAKEEFYQKRDELVDALNQYNFGKIVSKEQKMMLDYKLFHKELNALKKKKMKWRTLWGTLPGAGGLTYLVSTFDPLLAVFTATFIGISCLVASIGAEIEISELNEQPPKEYITMEPYYALRKKSEDADKFMHDFQFLKEIPLYKDSNEDSDSVHSSLSDS